MSQQQPISEFATSITTIFQARVVVVQDDGSVMVICSGEGADECLCDVLQTSQERLNLAADDEVLVWIPSDLKKRGVILGRIGPSNATSVESALSPEVPEPETPTELVIEAKHSLTLRVGDGSITIREDGKILIKGKDLVSHAQRLNRIKGGAVQIN